MDSYSIQGPLICSSKFTTNVNYYQVEKDGDLILCPLLQVQNLVARNVFGLS